MSSLNDFKLGKLLGKGAFSRVFLVHRIIDGQTYAMKQVRISQLTDKEKQNSLNEIRILASLSHKNIIGYKDAFFDENSKTLNIVMEYADNGDMSQKIKYNLKHGLLFRENIIWNYLIQILEGLHYLHENNIIHRDLKSANIYLMKDGTIKIGDLNVSKIAKIGMAYTQTGTPYYASPEIWLDKPYDFKSDVWSLGCILYELCQLKPPFRGTSLKNLCYNIQRGIYEPIMSFYSEELKKIIYLMLRTDPKMRPTTGQILKSKLINNKKKELKVGQELDRIEMERYEKKELIDTIKMPRNMREINGNLPNNKYNKNKTKKLNEEMMKEDEYETNKRLKGFLNDEDKKEIQKLYGNNYNYNNKKINEINNLDINNYGINNGSNKNNYMNNDINNRFNNNYIGNKYQINNYNNSGDKSRVNNNIVKNKQNMFNKNDNINSDRVFINNDFSSINHKFNDKNNKDDLISLNLNLVKQRKRKPNNKFMRNMSDVEDNNNYIYKQNKTKENQKRKNKNIDDFISQNINIYNNINKYYYRNYFDLLSYNDNKMSQKPKLDKINMQKRPSNNDLIKNKINSDKSPTKFNYIFNNGNQFNNIKPENKMNNSICNTDTYTNDKKNFKLLMNNNYNPNININIYNNKDDKKPNFNNFDFVNNNINNGLYFNISPTKEKNNKNPTLDINLLESSSKKGKDNFYYLNDLEDVSNNIIPMKNKKGRMQKLRTENNIYLSKKNNNIIESINNRRQSDTESLNSQIFKLNKKEINNKNKQNNNRYTNINKKGKIESSKTPNLKLPKNNNINNNKRKKLIDNNQLSSKNDMSDNYSNILLNSKNNNYIRNAHNNNLKKPNLLLNLDDYHPQLYVGINNKYRNYHKLENNYIPYPSSENRFDGIINNKLKSNGLNLDKNINSINNRNYNNNNDIEKLVQKNKSEYLKKMSNNLVFLNENDNIVFNNKIGNNNNKYKKQSNFIHRMANYGEVNKNKKRPVSSIVQRKIENNNSNRFKRFEPSFNNQLKKINNISKFNDSLDEINNINNFYSNKSKVITESNNMNNIRLNKLNNLNNNIDLMNYRNKVKKNKLEIINNFNNYIEHKNKIKNDFRKIDVNYNKSEKMRNINKNNNQRVITPSPDIFDKRKREENGKITNKYKLKKLNGKIGSTKANITDFNESLSYIPNILDNNNNVNRINKIEVQIHPKKKGKVIIEKYEYQPIKKRISNNNKNINLNNINNNMNNYHYLLDEYNNNNIKIFEKYNINNNNNLLLNNKFLNNSDIIEIKNKKQINYLDYNNYQYQNEIKYDNINNFINKNIYGQQNKINNFILKQDLNKYNRNYIDNNILNNDISYGVGNNENINSFLNYLNYDYKL